MSQPSHTETVLRQQIEQSRSEVLSFEKTRSHLESKLETYDKECDETRKASAEYMQAVATTRAKLTEITHLIEARTAALPQLEAAVRQVAINDALLYAHQTAQPPPVSHPQHVLAPVAVPNKLPDLQRTLFYGNDKENVEEWIPSFRAYIEFYSATLNSFDAIVKEIQVHLKAIFSKDVY